MPHPCYLHIPPLLADLAATAYGRARDEAELCMLLGLLYSPATEAAVWALYTAGKLGTAADACRHILAGDHLDAEGMWHRPLPRELTP